MSMREETEETALFTVTLCFFWNALGRDTFTTEGVSTHKPDFPPTTQNVNRLWIHKRGAVLWSHDRRQLRQLYPSRHLICCTLHDQFGVATLCKRHSIHSKLNGLQLLQFCT